MIKYCFILLVVMCSCGQAKFIVTSKTSTGVFDNCTVGLKPITSRAERMSNRIDSALVSCDEYHIGDTIVINRKEFTNF